MNLRELDNALVDARARGAAVANQVRLTRRALAEAEKAYGAPSAESVTRAVLAQSQADRAAGIVARAESVGPSHYDRSRQRNRNPNLGWAAPRPAVGLDGKLVRPGPRSAPKLPSAR